MRLKDHLNKIEYFCKIVESGSIKRASKAAFIGQPQLTKVVQHLEDILGTSLLVRSAKGIMVTRAGDQLYQYAKKILQLTDEAEYAVKSKQDSVKGELRIGTYDSIARYFFPEFLRYLKVTAPEMRVRLETGRSSDILARLKKSELDIIIIVQQASIPKNIASKEIYRDEFYLYHAPDLSVDFERTLICFRHEQLDLDDLQRQINFVEEIICDNLETVRSLTEQGAGIGLLPGKVAKKSLLLKRLVPFQGGSKLTQGYDKHKIILAHRNDQVSKEKTFALEEIERFLSLWSKS